MTSPLVLLLESLEWTIFTPDGEQIDEETKTGAADGQRKASAFIFHPGQTVWMEGRVHHRRQEQAENRFTYRIRMALVLLDAPPPWFAGDHLGSSEARAIADTDGHVLLLTDPSSLGYHQNPISIYYCYRKDGSLGRCIAEVTNTPWAERVTFPFDASGDQVPKPMHVSPFLDMNRNWRLSCSNPIFNESDQPADRLPIERSPCAEKNRCEKRGRVRRHVTMPDDAVCSSARSERLNQREHTALSHTAAPRHAGR